MITTVQIFLFLCMLKSSHCLSPCGGNEDNSGVSKWTLIKPNAHNVVDINGF